MDVRILFTIGLLASLHACCPFIKEEYLGHNLYLSEYDSVDRRILYAEESCSKSGMEIIPMTVLAYNYDAKWVIAKPGNKRQNSNIQYWIIMKDNDAEPTLDIIQANTIGPLDKDLFFRELLRRQIQLKLGDIK